MANGDEAYAFKYWTHWSAASKLSGNFDGKPLQSDDIMSFIEMVKSRTQGDTFFKKLISHGAKLACEAILWHMLVSVCEQTGAT